jgi:AcrR family transcriptional regulator
MLAGMARGRANSGGRGGSASQATRARILEATLETIKAEGMLGTSARAIARAGNFNQASIYYHFGSIDEAVIAALKGMSEDRLARYERQLVRVTSLPELVKLAAELHREDVESGTILVLSQAMSAAAGDDRFGKEMAAVFQPWIDLVARALRQALVPSALGASLPLDELAYAVSALFVGIEVLDQLKHQASGSDSLFAAIEGIARLVDVMLQTGAGNGGAPLDVGAQVPSAGARETDQAS